MLTIISYVVLYLIIGYLSKLWVDYDAYSRFKKHKLALVYKKDLGDNIWVMVFWPIFLVILLFLIIGDTGHSIIEKVWNYFNKNKEGK